METVKAVINIGEVVIQLEGPREFVERYLDQYQAIIEKGLTLPSAPRRNSKEAEVRKAEKPTLKRTRTVKSKAGPTATAKIQELIDESYFKEPKRRADVQEELLKRGVRYESSLISAVLNNLFKGSKLLKTGVGNKAQYYTNI